MTDIVQDLLLPISFLILPQVPSYLYIRLYVSLCYTCLCPYTTIYVSSYNFIAVTVREGHSGSREFRWSLSFLATLLSFCTYFTTWLSALLLVISVALSKTHLQTHTNYVHIEFSHGASQPDTSFRQPEAVEWVTDMTGQPLDFSHGAKLVKNTGVTSDKIPIRNSEKYLGCLATYWHPRFRSVLLLHRSS